MQVLCPELTLLVTVSPAVEILFQQVCYKECLEEVKVVVHHDAEQSNTIHILNVYLCSMVSLGDI